MNSSKVDMRHLPSQDKRPLVGPYAKTLILLSGGSNIGKSTLMELLMNPNFDYISVDKVCQCADLAAIQSFMTSCEGSDIPIALDLGRLFNFIVNHCAGEFIQHLFSTYIANNENDNIFIEGCLLEIPTLYNIFVEVCKLSGYRLWELRRTI